MPDLTRLREEQRRLNDPIVIATVAAHLFGKPGFEDKAKALNGAAEWLWDARKIRVPPADGISQETWTQFDEWARLEGQKFLSFGDFVERLTSGIRNIQLKARIASVKRLWPKLDWDWNDKEPLDLKASENWNEKNVDWYADKIARLYHEERRKNMSRPGQKK
jgi:hypothetical protein